MDLSFDIHIANLEEQMALASENDQNQRTFLIIFGIDRSRELDSAGM
jgi:hypothetical protein